MTTFLCQVRVQVQFCGGGGGVEVCFQGVGVVDGVPHQQPPGHLGSLVKQRLAQAKGWDPAQVYHVPMMPCYDKKLEASRDDFLVPGGCLEGTLRVCEV